MPSRWIDWPLQNKNILRPDSFFKPKNHAMRFFGIAATCEVFWPVVFLLHVHGLFASDLQSLKRWVKSHRVVIANISLVPRSKSSKGALHSNSSQTRNGNRQKKTLAKCSNGVFGGGRQGRMCRWATAGRPFPSPSRRTKRRMGRWVILIHPEQGSGIVSGFSARDHLKRTSETEKNNTTNTSYFRSLNSCKLLKKFKWV